MILTQKSCGDNPLKPLMPGERWGRGNRGKSKPSKRQRMIVLVLSRYRTTIGVPNPWNMLAHLKSNFSLLKNYFKLLRYLNIINKFQPMFLFRLIALNELHIFVGKQI